MAVSRAGTESFAALAAARITSPLDRRVAAMPVELGEDGICRVLEPVLTRQERTRLENAISNP